MLTWSRCITCHPCASIALKKYCVVKYNSMKKIMKNKKGDLSAQAGFIQIIIVIIIALFIMKYLGITVSGVISWFMTTFENVLR